MRRFAIAPSPSGFLVATAMSMLPAVPLGLLLALCFPAAPPPVEGLDGTWRGALVALALVCVLAPVLETLVLLYTSSLARQALAHHALACIVGALPVILMHAPQGWRKVVAVAWPFVWSTHCNFALTDQDATLRIRFLFLAGMHAATNGVLVGWLIARQAGLF